MSRIKELLVAQILVKKYGRDINEPDPADGFTFGMNFDFDEHTLQQALALGMNPNAHHSTGHTPFSRHLRRAHVPLSTLEMWLSGGATLSAASSACAIEFFNGLKKLCGHLNGLTLPHWSDSTFPRYSLNGLRHVLPFIQYNRVVLERHEKTGETILHVLARALPDALIDDAFKRLEKTYPTVAQLVSVCDIRGRTALHVAGTWKHVNNC